jgi:hypothetical protein
MHKSILIFLGLLTFLIPVAPSSMSNSNALAFSDYGYQADQYENYAKDMANDNYYKSQGSDVVKKIKCNNINSNFNGVDANIGIDDPLGVGAASIQDDASSSWLGNGQANNGNFDLDCINNNNNAGGQGGDGTGPQGPAGPRGPQGLPGTPGPSTVTTENVYTNLGPVRGNIFTNDLGSSVALCDEGDTALSGSFFTNRFAVIQQSKPLANETGWNATAQTVFSGTGTVQADVVCFDNPPAHVEMAAADVSTFQQSEDAGVMSQGLVNSPAISQVTEDSPELTATEKITKLKTQWLKLLPENNVESNPSNFFIF